MQNRSGLQKIVPMSLLACFIQLVIMQSVTLAAFDDCSKFKERYWNGTQCVTCSGCPRAFGVKAKCSSKQNTECQPCWPGFDYSNTTGFEPCIPCDKYSNCQEGNAKKIKNCTIFSPPICEGCADGNFLDSGYGENGGCIKCSPPCTILEVETRQCSTAHDRKCSVKITVPITTVLSTPSTVSGTKSIPSSTSSATEEDGQGSDERDYSPELDENPVVKRPWFWIVVVVAVGLVGSPVMAFMLIRCKRPQKRHNNGDVHELKRLFPSIPRGLDLPIKYLTIEGKTFLAQRLNGRDNYGYYYWQITAEKLDLFEESKAWEGAENPTEKLLTAYGEKEGSTIKNLIAALREAGLTHFANEIERRFSDQGEHEPEHIDGTIV